MVTTTYRQAFDLACAQGHPRGKDGSVWPNVERGYGVTTGLLLPPEHEDAAEICAEVGDEYYVELLKLLAGGAR